eukprot:TRINITY_DN266_c0_g1_i1.p1 TRINITY_DN266_c0_g1~~TRINITY_DN266_c0_g1_i1.p1  ORF type:complete len:313 (+),score=99.28 TRINITY_DN266_c0_g1_i1:88-1026(+)
MKSRYFSLLSVLLLVGSVISSSIQTTPVFMWTNTNQFVGKNSQYAPLTGVESIYDSFSSKGPLSSFVSKDKKSLETIVLFVEPTLNSQQVSNLAEAHSSNPDGGVFANLKNYIENSQSSFVAPYVTSENDIVGSKLATKLAEMKSINGQVILVSSQEGSIDTSKVVTKMTQSEFLSSKSVLVNGKTDLVVVQLNGDLKNDDELVKLVIEKVGQSSFLAIYCAEKISSESIERRYPESHDSLRDFEANFSQSLEQSHDHDDDLPDLPIWNDDIVMGLILSIPLLLILSVGTRCLYELQSELKFPNVSRNKKTN